MTKTEEFKSLRNDVDRFKWLIAHKDDSDYIVYLDNDQTFIVFNDDKDGADFDGWLGWSDGVVSLLKAIGINAESV